MSFFFPKITRSYIIRVVVVAVVSLVFFGFVCRPCVIHGRSMEPTYASSGFTFCWCPRAWHGKFRPGDVVIVQFMGRSRLLLKRLVAMEGDTVEFRHGVLLVNGKELQGAWQVKGPCNWELPPRIVAKGNVYVVGDNRSMPIEQHIFGQLSASRIIGVPLW